MVTAIIQTGTTTAIVETGTLTAIKVTDTAVAAPTGGGSGGSSKQVGVSLVNKQQQIPPKRRRLVESQFVVEGQLYQTFETPVRVKSKLKVLFNNSELVLDGKILQHLKSSMEVIAHPLVPMGTRLELTGKSSMPVKTEIQVEGKRDWSEFDRLLQLARLLEKD